MERMCDMSEEMDDSEALPEDREVETGSEKGNERALEDRKMTEIVQKEIDEEVLEDREVTKIVLEEMEREFQRIGRRQRLCQMNGGWGYGGWRLCRRGLRRVWRRG
ncbi:hypothetical protein Fot_24280 [Forsythia ovata]|uniref:Uncharacterized protein n=1 Tax=Forsythia ovata TaxID=205694 RepID=A0ABD1U5S5_9LAMI